MHSEYDANEARFMRTREMACERRSNDARAVDVLNSAGSFLNAKPDMKLTA
jgi:hypothetical protein